MHPTDGTGSVAGWYSNTNASSSSEELLQATFTHAKLLLRSILSPADFSALFPPPSTQTPTQTTQTVSKTSIYDIQQCLKAAQAAYETRAGCAADAASFHAIAPSTAVPTSLVKPSAPLEKARAKARVWLVGLSEKIVFYGNVFDVLVQHHPEYVSLAWGTFKFLFIAITNHAETASKLSKSISQIADLLPQQSLHLILYPTPQMQASVARLYAHILNFFVEALKWYRDKRITHALKSIFQPWNLKFRQDYEVIEFEALRIRRLAKVAMRAEVRDTRLGVVQGTKELELVKQEVVELRAENQRLHDLLFSRLEKMESSMLCVYQELRVDFTSQRETLNRVHITQMMSLPLWNSLPTSGDSLHFCRSMRNRRRERTRLPLPEVEKLRMWSSQRNNAVLLIGTFVPNTAKTFMVDLIDLILENDMPIVWALRYADYWHQRLSLTDIMRTLVLQAMQLGGRGLLNSAFPVTVEQLREAASPNDWVAILKRLLSGIDHAFIVLDPDLLAHATEHERSMSLEMLDILKTQLSGNIKIVIAMSTVSRDYAQQLESAGECVKIQTGNSDWRTLRRHKRTDWRAGRRSQNSRR